MSGRGAIALGLAAGIAAGGAVIAVNDATDQPAAAPRASVALAPPPARPALAIPAPEGLDDGPDVTRWAHVRTATAARTAPRLGAAVAGRVAARTPEGTTTVVPVTGRTEDAGGRLWLRVTLPKLPNGTSGWVPRRALGGYEISRDKLVIDLDARAADAAAPRQGGDARADRGRAVPLAHPARALHRAQPARALRLAGVRTGRVRDERPVGDADGLAGRGVHRHPRHESS